MSFVGVLHISCKILLTIFRVLEGGQGRDDNADGVEGGVNCFLGGVRFLKVIKRSFIYRFLVVFLVVFLGILVFSGFLDFLATFLISWRVS